MFTRLSALSTAFGTAALGLLLAALPGCAGTALPTVYAGPSSYQVSQATRYDPYPDPTIGPPVVGGRPIGYLDPRPSPDPNKILPPSPGYGNPVAAPPYAPVYGPPAAYYPPPVAGAVVNQAPIVTSPVASAAVAPAGAIPWSGATSSVAPTNGTNAAPSIAYGKAIGTP